MIKWWAWTRAYRRSLMLRSSTKLPRESIMLLSKVKCQFTWRFWTTTCFRSITRLCFMLIYHDACCSDSFTRLKNLIYFNLECYKNSHWWCCFGSSMNLLRILNPFRKVCLFSFNVLSQATLNKNIYVVN